MIGVLRKLMNKNQAVKTPHATWLPEIKRFALEITCALVVFAAGIAIISQSRDGMTAHAQSSSQTPCLLNGSLTATGTSFELDNRNLGCYQFRVNYSSVGF